MTVKIRLAQYGDLFGLNRMLNMMREEAGDDFPQPEYPAALIALLERISDNLVWVAYEEDAEKGDKLVGMVLLRLSVYDGAPSQRYLETCNLYVIPEARSKSTEDGKPVASGLIEAAKNTSVMASVALQKWIPLVCGIDFGDDRVDLKEALVERHGFKRKGANFIRIPSEDDLPDEAKQELAAAREAAE